LLGPFSKEKYAIYWKAEYLERLRKATKAFSQDNFVTQYIHPSFPNHCCLISVIGTALSKLRINPGAFLSRSGIQ
jgi:hypothetical protein